VPATGEDSEVTSVGINEAEAKLMNGYNTVGVVMEGVVRIMYRILGATAIASVAGERPKLRSVFP